MRIERWDPADAASTRHCYEVWQAAAKTDDPQGAPKSQHVTRAWMKRGYNGQPGEVWFVPAEAAGQPGADAWYRLGLPYRENLTRAGLHILVRPAARRRGLGTELLRHATQRARANGRTVLAGNVRENSAGEAFVRQAGAKIGITEVRRMLDLAALPAGQVARLREQAAAAAAGYSLVSWTGATPEEYLAAIAASHEAMNDAPHNEGVESQAWDAERVRQQDAEVTILGMRAHSVAARHDATGEMAGLTQVYVDPETPEWGHQGLTAVTRPHRGHRLGLLVKAAMLEWLATAEPQLTRIDTGNAASNQHMIGVNEKLGFRVHGPGWVSCELPVAGAENH